VHSFASEFGRDTPRVHSLAVERATKKRKAGTSPAFLLRSQYDRLRLQEPDSELGTSRGPLPPELPAGKRGGWYHDSVYPTFRLTSFAPRAVNFGPECISPKPPILAGIFATGTAHPCVAAALRSSCTTSALRSAARGAFG